MENRFGEKHEFQKLFYIEKKSRTCLGPLNVLKILKTWNPGVPDQTCTEYVWWSLGVNIDKVFVFCKIQIYTRCFWGSTSFGMWHFATGVLFSQYFNELFSLHCGGSMILTLQPLKMKTVCSFKTLVHTSPQVQLHIAEDLNSHMFWYCLGRLIWLRFGCIKLCVIVVKL